MVASCAADEGMIEAIPCDVEVGKIKVVQCDVVTQLGTSGWRSVIWMWKQENWIGGVRY